MDVAVYKGDEFLCVGTIKECAESLGVQPDTIRFYLSPAYEKRLAKRKKSYKSKMIVIRLDEDE